MILITGIRCWEQRTKLEMFVFLSAFALLVLYDKIMLEIFKQLYKHEGPRIHYVSGAPLFYYCSPLFYYCAPLFYYCAPLFYYYAPLFYYCAPLFYYCSRNDAVLRQLRIRSFRRNCYGHRQLIFTHKVREREFHGVIYSHAP